MRHFETPILHQCANRIIAKDQISNVLSFFLLFLISVFPEQILNSSSYLADSPAVQNWIQERINENGSCHVVIGDFHC